LAGWILRKISAIVPDIRANVKAIGVENKADKPTSREDNRNATNSGYSQRRRSTWRNLPLIKAYMFDCLNLYVARFGIVTADGENGTNFFG
jgi:hypothetical protein